MNVREAAAYFRQFSSLAIEDPQELLRILVSGELEPHDLTFAAEAAGAVVDRAVAIAALLQLVDHESPIVREGMVYGVARDVSSSDAVRSALCSLADYDPSPGVRAAAIEALQS